MIDTVRDLVFLLPNAPAAAIGKEDIGSKAHGLMRLTQLGLPVPPAFVLGTHLCREYFRNGGILSKDMRELLVRGLAKLEEATDCRFGASRRPLLLSVRSGAAVSMPGMMETILNVGLCEQSLRGLVRATGNPRQAWDCYRRLIRDFSEVVHGTETGPFERLVAERIEAEHIASANELDVASLSQITKESLETALAMTGQPFPQDPMDQLVAAVDAVFRSWNSDKAKSYRKHNGIDDDLGTAVTVQAMVFGNAGGTSGAGVGFTRDPANGEDRLYLDFLFNAQGEDVVAGKREVRESDELQRRLPAVAAELTRAKSVLEQEFLDMQDFEFTVENGRLFLLQTRDGKRTPWAALKIVIDMVRHEVITPEEGLKRLDAIPVESLERIRFADAVHAQPLATATPASIGVAVGEIALDSNRAAERAAGGKPVILVRESIATSDIDGIMAAAGVLTTAGGRTSHAAVVARQLGKVCLVGCRGLRIDEGGKACSIGGRRLFEGETLTLDGDSGTIYAGAIPVVRERPHAELAEIARWRDAVADREKTPSRGLAAG